MNSLEMLGFSSSSVIPPESEVNTAYRKAAKMWHPDRFVDAREKEMATERFKLISQARDDLLAHKILEYNPPLAPFFTKWLNHAGFRSRSRKRSH